MKVCALPESRYVRVRRDLAKVPSEGQELHKSGQVGISRSEDLIS